MSPMDETYVNEKNSSPEDTQLQYNEVTDNVPTFSAEEERRIYRRIDLRCLVGLHCLSGSQYTEMI